MKPFNLGKALAGEPVRLRNGAKAYVKFVLPEPYSTKMPLVGYYISKKGNSVDNVWFEDGKVDDRFDCDTDIIGMWQEPRPRVQLDLPASLKEPQEGIWFINKIGMDIEKSSYSQENPEGLSANILLSGRYFATKEDAQEWLDALKGARR